MERVACTIRPPECQPPGGRGGPARPWDQHLAGLLSLRGDLRPGRGLRSDQEATAGELVKVRLALTLKNPAYYLLVEDYLPAGAEILNTGLKTSQQALLPEDETLPLYDPEHPFEQGWGWWLFSAPRIFDDHIAWAVDYLPAGTYELTYYLSDLQPGEYRVLPARAWQFYFPDVQGNSSGELFAIKPSN